MNTESESSHPLPRRVFLGTSVTAIALGLPARITAAIAADENLQLVRMQVPTEDSSSAALRAPSNQVLLAVLFSKNQKDALPLYLAFVETTIAKASFKTSRDAIAHLRSMEKRFVEAPLEDRVKAFSNATSLGFGFAILASSVSRTSTASPRASVSYLMSQQPHLVDSLSTEEKALRDMVKRVRSGLNVAPYISLTPSRHILKTLSTGGDGMIGTARVLCSEASNNLKIPSLENVTLRAAASVVSLKSMAVKANDSRVRATYIDDISNITDGLKTVVNGTKDFADSITRFTSLSKTDFLGGVNAAGISMKNGLRALESVLKIPLPHIEAIESGISAASTIATALSAPFAAPLAIGSVLSGIGGLLFGGSSGSAEMLGILQSLQTEVRRGFAEMRAHFEQIEAKLEEISNQIRSLSEQMAANQRSLLAELDSLHRILFDVQKGEVESARYLFKARANSLSMEAYQLHVSGLSTKDRENGLRAIRHAMTAATQTYKSKLFAEPGGFASPAFAGLPQLKRMMEAINTLRIPEGGQPPPDYHRRAMDIAKTLSVPDFSHGSIYNATFITEILRRASPFVDANKLRIGAPHHVWLYANEIANVIMGIPDTQFCQSQLEELQKDIAPFVYSFELFNSQAGMRKLVAVYRQMASACLKEYTTIIYGNYAGVAVLRFAACATDLINDLFKTPRTFVERFRGFPESLDGITGVNSIEPEGPQVPADEASFIRAKDLRSRISPIRSLAQRNLDLILEPLKAELKTLRDRRPLKIPSRFRLPYEDIGLTEPQSISFSGDIDVVANAYERLIGLVTTWHDAIAKGYKAEFDPLYNNALVHFGTILNESAPKFDDAISSALPPGTGGLKSALMNLQERIFCTSVLEEFLFLRFSPPYPIRNKTADARGMTIQGSWFGPSMRGAFTHALSNTTFAPFCSQFLPIMSNQFPQSLPKEAVFTGWNNYPILDGKADDDWVSIVPELGRQAVMYYQYPVVRICPLEKWLTSRPGDKSPNGFSSPALADAYTCITSWGDAFAVASEDAEACAALANPSAIAVCELAKALEQTLEEMAINVEIIKKKTASFEVPALRNAIERRIAEVFAS